VIPLSKNKIDSFCRIFDVPEFVTPWLHRFFEIQEIELVLDLADQKDNPSRDTDFLNRCNRRGLISFDADGNPLLADFHVRYDIWALFEGWQDVPDEIRIKLNRWELASYVARKRLVIEESLKTGRRDRTHPWSEFALLDEALAMIDRVPHIYQWPCNCRAMMKGCLKPEYVCLRFTNDRNLGWEISKTRAKEILRHAHQKGLIHNVGLSLLADGSIDGGICNCCSDCCYDHQLASELGIKPFWPINRYVASYSEGLCSACGRCSKRCPYHAFTMAKKQPGGDQPPVKVTLFDSNLCRGCGLCVSTCPEKAIEMKSLEPSPLSIMDDLLKAN
jgi:ferredoxin